MNDMRNLLLIIAAALTAWAQQPSPQSLKTFSSSKEVQDMIANAKKIRKPDQALVAQPILLLAPYRVSLEYRAIAGTAAVHEKEAELFYVIDGAGTLTTGGKMEGTEIAGGTPQAVAKGDFIIVPENTPHAFTEVKSPLVLMSLHIPRTGEK
jgi:mannose-6-phosphate isomerase-like protein (cupin superfamily)